MTDRLGQEFLESPVAQFTLGLYSGTLAGGSFGGAVVGGGAELSGATENWPTEFKAGYGIGELGMGLAGLVEAGIGLIASGGLISGGGALTLSGAGAPAGVLSIVGGEALAAGSLVVGAEALTDVAVGGLMLASAWDDAGGGGGGAWERATSRGEKTVSPNDLRFSQTRAGGGEPPRSAALREQLADGWDPDMGAVDVIETPDGLLTLDNTRVAVAQELGLESITVRIRGLDEALPTSFPSERLAFFQAKAEKLSLPDPTTWGDLFKIRLMDNHLPVTGTTTRPRMP